MRRLLVVALLLVCAEGSGLTFSTSKYQQELQYVQHEYDRFVCSDSQTAYCLNSRCGECGLEQKHDKCVRIIAEPCVNILGLGESDNAEYQGCSVVEGEYAILYTTIQNTDLQLEGDYGRHVTYDIQQEQEQIRLDLKNVHTICEQLQQFIERLQRHLHHDQDWKHHNDGKHPHNEDGKHHHDRKHHHEHSPGHEHSLGHDENENNEQNQQKIVMIVSIVIIVAFVFLATYVITRKDSSNPDNTIRRHERAVLRKLLF